MLAKKFLPLIAIAAFWGCADINTPAGAEVDLLLTQVDGKPLPFSVGILSGTTSTLVNSGSLIGNNVGPDCKLTLVTNGDPIKISVFPCTLNSGDVIDYPLDLGNNTGMHLYRFR